MRLRPVRFVGHKIGPFEHIELNWSKDSRSTLIVGENGSGKTTLIVAMAACLNKNETFLLDRVAYSPESYAYFEVMLGNRKVCFLQDAHSTDLSYMSNINRELGYNLAEFSDNCYSLLGPWEHGRSLEVLAAAYGSKRDIEIRNNENLSDTKILQHLLDPFYSISSQDIEKWMLEQWKKYAYALADNYLEEAKAYWSIIPSLEKVLSDILKVTIKLKVEREPLRFVVKQGEHQFLIDKLSDGTRNYLSWMLDYLMWASRVNWADPKDSATAPGMVLVDEIDSHLHPEWQRRVMSSVAQLLPETYVIATTHSPFVVASAKDAQIFRLYRDEQGKIVVHSNEDGLYGYPADLVLKKEFLIGSELYPPKIEDDLVELSQLAGKLTFNIISEAEREKHDQLLKELAETNPWLESLLTLSQAMRSNHD